MGAVGAVVLAALPARGWRLLARRLLGRLASRHRRRRTLPLRGWRRRRGLGAHEGAAKSEGAGGKSEDGRGGDSCCFQRFDSIQGCLVSTVLPGRADLTPGGTAVICVRGVLNDWRPGREMGRAAVRHPGTTMALFTWVRMVALAERAGRVVDSFAPLQRWIGRAKALFRG